MSVCLLGPRVATFPERSEFVLLITQERFGFTVSS